MDQNTGMISGVIPKTAVGDQYDITVQAQPMLNLQKPGAFLDLQPASTALTLSVEAGPVCNLPTKIEKYSNQPLTGVNAVDIA